MKVSDKIKERVERGEQFFSFEFFPPRTEEVRGAAQRQALEREALGEGVAARAATDTIEMIAIRAKARDD